MDFTSHIARAHAILADEWQYTPKLGITRAVKADFRNPAAEYLGVEGTNPSLICLLADVPEASIGDKWQRGNEVYVSQSPKRDSQTGTVEIQLDKL